MRPNHFFKTTIERDDNEVAIEVEYNATPGCRGSRDSLGGVRGAGPPLEPDSPPEIEIIKAVSVAGIEITLTDSEIDKIETELWSELEELRRDAQERPEEDR